MAIPSASLSKLSSSLSLTKPKFSHLFFPSFNLSSSHSKPSFTRLSVSSSSSKPSHSTRPDLNKPKEPYYELYHNLPLERSRKGIPVYITLPPDILDPSGKLKRAKALRFSFLTFSLVGFEGIVMEIWWGRVEKEPMEYNWNGYLEIVKLAEFYGLKVRAVMGFYEFRPRKDFEISLPDWVRQEMIENPELAYSDRFGRRSYEYISLGCDNLPVLKGRSPIQTYSDFMRNFRDAFKNYLGITINGVQVGMGPAGELRYPSAPSSKLTWSWRFRELGEFQCHDEYMLASLRNCAQEIGKHGWGIGSPLDVRMGGPIATANMIHNPMDKEFFKSDGSWNTPYGKFFLEWYSGMLLQHGERLCTAAESIFCGTGVSIFAKVAGIHTFYDTESHASELTAGYYNTSNRDGYLPLACMFARHGIILCYSRFEMKDKKEKVINPLDSPEGLLRQILLAARTSDLPLDGEISTLRINYESLNQVLKVCEFHSDGLDIPIFSFNIVRMNPRLISSPYWTPITQFVKHMSDGNFQARLGFEGGDLYLSSMPAAEEDGSALAHC